jgi:hypothetical protein
MLDDFRRPGTTIKAQFYQTFCEKHKSAGVDFTKLCLLSGKMPAHSIWQKNSLVNYTNKIEAKFE